MRTSTIVWVIVILLILLGGWWYVSSQNAMQLPAAAPTATQTTSAPALGVSNSASVGNYLIASNSMTLYRFTKDKVGTSTCYGACAALWPAYTVSSTAALNAAAQATGTIGTITRTDGTLQVTYNGLPIYFYAKDINPGDTLGQGIGGIWFVMTP